MATRHGLLTRASYTQLWLSSLLVGRPQRQVITQELHDEGGIFVGILRNVVKLRNGIFERSTCHFTSFVWVAQNFILENRVVQGEAQTDWMRDCQVFFCRFAFSVTIRELSDVTVVVGLHPM